MGSCLDMTKVCKTFFGNVGEIIELTASSINYITYLNSLIADEKTQLAALKQTQKVLVDILVSQSLKRVSTLAVSSPDYMQAVKTACPMFYRLLKVTWIQAMVPVMTLAARIIEVATAGKRQPGS
jgi:DNA-binding TFAR19-related protein (PDSD5 family)